MSEKPKRKFKKGTLFKNLSNSGLFVIGESWLNVEKNEYCYRGFYVNTFEVEKPNMRKIRSYWESKLSDTKKFVKVNARLAKALYTW